jgi:hypothetical protein
VWYGVVAGDGLRSVGEAYLPLTKSGCSILPTARHSRAGAQVLPARASLKQRRSWPYRDGEKPTSGYYQGMAEWRESIREQIAQLERQRSRLEEVRLRAQSQGGPEGERLEAQASARLREIEQRIAELRASLE